MATVDQIRATLAGSDSKHTVTEQALLRVSQSEAEGRQALELMFNRREVNRCKVIRGGKENMVYWLTGLVADAFWREFSINPAKRSVVSRSARADQMGIGKHVKPVINTKEASMAEREKSAIGQRNGLSLALLDLVGQRPSIRLDQVCEALPGYTRKQIVDNANHLVRRNKMRKLEMYGCIFYYLQETSPTPSKPSKKTEARPFRCAMFNDGTLLIESAAGHRVELTRDETTALYRFLSSQAELCD